MRFIELVKIIIIIIRIIFFPIKILNNLIYGNPARTIVGYAWYSRHEYQVFLDSAEDDLDTLVPTYIAWKTNADKRVAEMKEKGWLVFKVQIRMNELNAWLTKNSLVNISENRERYVDERLVKFLEHAEI